MEILLLWAGLLLVWIGALVLAAARDSPTAARADGEVIGYAPRGGSGGATTYAPVVAFAHPTGGRRVFEGALASNAFRYRVGERVAVLVDAEDQGKARLEGSGVRWVGVALIGFGALPCALFLAIFRWNAWSVGTAAVVSGALALQARKNIGDPRKLGAAGAIRSALSGASVEERLFDRGRLLAPEELASRRRALAKQAAWVGALLILLGLGAMALGGRLSRKRAEFLARALPAAGRVVELAMHRDTEGTAMYAPVVEYPLPSGGSTRFRHSISRSRPSWRVGDSVAVLYDPAAPGSAIIDQGWLNTALPRLPSAAGLLFVAGGALALRRSSDG